MRVRTRRTPACGVARVLLEPGETVQAVAGSLLACSYGTGVEATPGGPFRSLGRSWRGAAVFTAPAGGGWVDLAPALPGDLHVLDLEQPVGWCVARDGWLAACATVRLDAQWPGFRSLFGGDATFLAHAGGTGPLVLRCCGAVEQITLGPGELVTLDPGHVLAYPDTMQCRLRAVSPSGAQSVRTGEGLLLDFAGPGQVVVQTHSPRVLAAWLAGLSSTGRD